MKRTLYQPLREFLPARQLLASLGLVFWIVGRAFSVAPADYSQEIGSLMATLFARGHFNGAVLVAQEAKIIYRNAFGKMDFQSGADFTAETPSDIGSVTKQFTAMTIMILAEQNKLKYDDLLSKYIPEFSRSLYLSEISLRQLLAHTSGIPDYGDLGIDNSGLPTSTHRRDSVERGALRHCLAF
jgi:CubicO group peptidase (beta-lactamase class C family)